MFSRASTLYQNSVLADNPTGFWTLGETSGSTAYDSSGNSLNGTYQPGTAFGASGPFAGTSAASFDGSAAYVSLPGTWGGTSAISVEAWIYETANTGNFEAIVEPTNASFVHLQTSLGGNTVVYTNNGGASLPIVTLQLDRWEYVVIEAGNNTESLYANGTLVGTTNLSFSQISPANPNDLRIGSGYQSGRFFDGEIADVAIYATALTSGQITAHYNAGVQSMVPEPGSGSLASIGLLVLAGLTFACRSRRA